MFTHARLAWLAAALATLLLARTPAQAAVPEVRDNAGLFKAETVKKADVILQDIKREHNQELVIETYPGIPADRQAAWQAEQNDPEKRKHFFAEWGRERFRALNVNGIYLLIAKDPSQVQIEVGNVTVSRAFTMNNRDRLEEIMVAHLKDQDYDAGLLAGTDYVRRAMNENLGGTAPPVVVEVEQRPRFFTLALLGWLCLGLTVLAGVIAIVFLVIRPRRGAGRGTGPDVPGRISE